MPLNWALCDQGVPLKTGVKQIIASFVQLALVAAIAWQFLIVAPWFAAKPIEEISRYQVAGNVPENARSFAINHGEPQFFNHGTMAEQPVRFGLSVLLLAIEFAAMLLVTYTWGGSRRE